MAEPSAVGRLVTKWHDKATESFISEDAMDTYLECSNELRTALIALAADKASAALELDRSRTAIACLDCGCDYTKQRLDVTLSGEQWKMIHPDIGGVLCAACMVNRASKLPGVITFAARIAFGSDYDKFDGPLNPETFVAAAPQQAAGERSCCERMREACASLIASCDHYLCNTIIGLKAKPVDSIDQLADKIRALPLPPRGDRSAAEHEKLGTQLSQMMKSVKEES